MRTLSMRCMRRMDLRSPVMTETTWNNLRRLLVDHYDDFKSRLSRRLGSDDVASETLNETYLRLNREGDAGNITNPVAYLFRTALNVASDRLRSENRIMRRSDVAAVLELVDDRPDPERTASARLAMENLQAVIAELPWRQRLILIDARVHDMPHQEIADRLKISKRMVQLELRAAIEFCSGKLEKK